MRFLESDTEKFYLTDFCDILLPKLMSDELQIQHVDKLVAEL
jgi:hypothetical protein